MSWNANLTNRSPASILRSGWPSHSSRPRWSGVCERCSPPLCRVRLHAQPEARRTGGVPRRLRGIPAGRRLRRLRRHLHRLWREDHRLITSLERSGISPKLAQTLARHSDICLTLGIYTHVGLHDQTVAIGTFTRADPGKLAMRIGQGALQLAKKRTLDGSIRSMHIQQRDLCEAAGYPQDEPAWQQQMLEVHWPCLKRRMNLTVRHPGPTIEVASHKQVPGMNIRPGREVPWRI